MHTQLPSCNLLRSLTNTLQPPYSFLLFPPCSNRQGVSKEPQRAQTVPTATTTKGFQAANKEISLFPGEKCLII